jgi:acyl carrier protein
VNPLLHAILVDDLNLDPLALRPDSRLEEAGLDSLTIVELSMHLQDKHGVRIGEDALSAATTVNALHRLVDDHLTGR